MRKAIRSSDYNKGYRAGYKAGKASVIDGNPMTKTVVRTLNARWVLRDGEWYCSHCGTKNNQAHEDYCCKCGYKMSEEADFDEDN